jgi:hypothetical protein
VSERVSDQVLRNILADMDESDRLKTLTNRELVEDYLCDESDLAVEEMLTRLWPEWVAREVGH